MEEARQIKSALYPLSRDVKSLTTIILNIRNILQAEPEFFALAAPPGLLVLRRAMHSLLNSTLALQEINDIALRESTVAEKLAQNSMLPVLRPAARLRDAAENFSGPLSRCHTLIARLNGHLNPLFVYAIGLNPEVERFLSEVELTDRHITELKKTVGRLADQDIILGLAPGTDRQLTMFKPQIQALENDIEDIAQHSALIMGKMNLLSKLSGRLQPVLRIAGAMEGAVRELRAAMTTLMQLSRAFNLAQSRSERGRSMGKILGQELNKADLPMDALLEVEFTLQTQVERYVIPVLPALSDMTEEVKQAMPGNHFLRGLESTLVTQRSRFNLPAKRVERLLSNLDKLAQRGDLALQL